MAEQSFFTDKIALFVPGNAEAQARFERRIFRRYIMAPMAIGLLNAQAVHRVIAGELQAEGRAVCHNKIKHAGGKFTRDIKLIAQLADIGDAGDADAGGANFNHLAGAKREGGIRHIIGCERSKQCARIRPHQADGGGARGDIDNSHGFIVTDGIFEMTQIVQLRHRGGNDEILVLRHAGNG